LTTTSFDSFDELSFGACDRRRTESRGPHGGKTFVEIQDNVTPLASRSYETVNIDRSRFSFTDLTKTNLGGVQNKYFRLFEPVKLERMRLQTVLPEFWSLRHRANLSDRPVTTAARLGGHWSEYNLAAITRSGRIWPPQPRTSRCT
jgi:hypothetical protein